MSFVIILQRARFVSKKLTIKELREIGETKGKHLTTTDHWKNDLVKRMNIATG